MTDMSPVQSARPLAQALWRGAAHRCPACGQGRLFKSYLKVSDACAVCAQELHHHRADDAPPYFTMLIVGHVLVGGVLAVEQSLAPSSAVHAMIWLPLTIILCLLVLPITKGALVGLQWALRMHGFDSSPNAAGAKPAPETRSLSGH